MPPRGLPTLDVLPPVASSSVAPLSPASLCIATAACRSLALAAFPASRRSSALLAAYCGPSSLSSSPLARTTLLTPTPIICRHVTPPTAIRFLPLNSAISHRCQAKNRPPKIALISTRVEIQNSTQPTPSPNLARAPFLPTVGFRRFRFLKHPPVAPRRSEECRVAPPA